MSTIHILRPHKYLSIVSISYSYLHFATARLAAQTKILIIIVYFIITRHIYYFIDNLINNYNISVYIVIIPV